MTWAQLYQDFCVPCLKTGTLKENLVPGLPDTSSGFPGPLFPCLPLWILSCIQNTIPGALHLFIYRLLGSKLAPNMGTPGSHSLAIGFQFADLEVDQQVILAVAGTWGRPCHGAELSGGH